VRQRISNRCSGWEAAGSSSGVETPRWEAKPVGNWLLKTGRIGLDGCGSRVETLRWDVKPFGNWLLMSRLNGLDGCGSKVETLLRWEAKPVGNWLLKTGRIGLEFPVHGLPALPGRLYSGNS